jgi:hypothetical protein
VNDRKKEKEEWPQRGTKSSKGKQGRTTMSFELSEVSRSFFVPFVLLCGHSSLISSFRGHSYCTLEATVSALISP